MTDFLIALTLVTSDYLSSVITFWSLPTSVLSDTAAAVGIALISSLSSLGGHRAASNAAL